MVVSNTTTILFFIKLGRVDLLKRVHHHIIIPLEVFEELTSQPYRYEREVGIIQQLIRDCFLVVKQGSKKRNFGLDEGENSALSLCLELRENEFLSDDKAARKTASNLGLQVGGTLSVLLMNLKQKVITPTEFIFLLDELVQRGYYISTELYASVIQKISKIGLYKQR